MRETWWDAFLLTSPRLLIPLIIKFYLKAVGVRDALIFVKKYLTISDRSLVVKYGEAVSNLKPVGRGVPQGSTPGPLLCALYVNDLFY